VVVTSKVVPVLNSGAKAPVAVLYRYIRAGRLGASNSTIGGREGAAVGQVMRGAFEWESREWKLKKQI
jgi:hypothetical protein